MLDGFGKEDPPTMKKLPVEVDVPEYLVEMASLGGATELDRSAGDWSLIAYYYLLRIGEYTVKGSRNQSKQTKQFKMEDITFFKEYQPGKLLQVARDAPEEDILPADRATLKLDNMKNSWKGVCVNHEANGDQLYCPVRALGRRYVHIRRHSSQQKWLMSA